MNDRQQYSKVFNPKTIEEHIDVLKIHLNILNEFCLNHHEGTVESEEEHDAKFIIQLIISKINHLVKLSDGLYIFENSKRKFYDPSVNHIISRNIFETVIHFNSLFIYGERHNTRKLVQLLWKLSTLKHRTKLFKIESQDDKPTKISELENREKSQIEDLKTQIKNLNLYTNGCIKTKEQIDNAIKGKKYWVMIINGKVNTSIGPQKLCNEMTIDNILLEEQYTRFSLFTHPSKETINMLQNVKNFAAYEEMYKANIRVTNCLISMFLADYSKVFPQVLESFEKLPELWQHIATYYNLLIRERQTGIKPEIELP